MWLHLKQWLSYMRLLVNVLVKLFYKAQKNYTPFPHLSKNSPYPNLIFRGVAICVLCSRKDLPHRLNTDNLLLLQMNVYFFKAFVQHYLYTTCLYITVSQFKRSPEVLLQLDLVSLLYQAFHCPLWYGLFAEIYSAIANPPITGSAKVAT